MDLVAKYQAMDLGDYLAIIRRRKWALIGPFLVILALSVVVALMIPPVYRSEARILVERQEIPENFVQSTVTGYLAERVRALSERVLTHQNLWRIANEYDLYPDDRERLGRSEIVKQMRSATQIQTVDVKTNEVRGGISVTVAFLVAFEAGDPESARKVAAELTRLVLEENRRGRSEQAASVARYLDTEALRVKEEIAELDAKLAAFKQENRDVLPELSNVNMRLLEQNGASLERSEEKIRSLELQQSALQAQLGVTSMYVVTTGDLQSLNPVQRLGSLQAEYLRLSSVYAYDHPDLVKLRRQIAALEGQAGGGGGAGELFQQLDGLRSQLSAARSRYSESHPDVRKLKASIASLEKQLHKQTGNRSLRAAQVARNPTNPQYVGLQNQLNGVAANLIAEGERRAQLLVKSQEYELRLARTPLVEREQVSINRDYDAAVAKYREIRDKQLKARMAQQLESENKAERFVLLDPAYTPLLPESPNRPGIVLVGFLIAFTGGMGTASVAEFLDRSIRGMKSVAWILHAPPLAGIPYIDNPADLADRQRRKHRRNLIMLVVVVALFAAWHFLIMPLDQQWLVIRDWALGNSDAGL